MANCWYCGIDLNVLKNHPQMRTLDHVLPLSRGGTNYADNIVYSCLKCNNDKGSLTLEEYRAVIGLRFGSVVTFWAEGHSGHVRPSLASFHKSSGKPCLIAEVPKYRPVTDEESTHRRKLSWSISKQHGITASYDQSVFWECCPKLNKERSAESDLTGIEFGAGMRVHGIVLGIKSAAKYACRCSCGRFVARSSKAIRNPINIADCCQVCQKTPQNEELNRQMTLALDQEKIG